MVLSTLFRNCARWNTRGNQMTTKAYGVTMYAPTGGFIDDREEIPNIDGLFGKKLKNLYVKPQSKKLRFEFEDGSWFEADVTERSGSLQSLNIGSFEINV